MLILGLWQETIIFQRLAPNVHTLIAFNQIKVKKALWSQSSYNRVQSEVTGLILIVQETLLKLILHQLHKITANINISIVQFQLCANLFAYLRKNTHSTPSHRWPQWHFAPLETDPGNDGRHYPQSHPTGSALGSHQTQTATGTSASSGSPPGFAAVRICQRYGDGHIRGMSSDLS